jgi:hypothetical protein
MMEEKRTPEKAELIKILEKLGVCGIKEDDISAFTSDEDGFEYAVWLVDTGEEKLVLKRAKGLELECYKGFFAEKKPYVPALLGVCDHEGEEYFLTEYCEGSDLRICDRARLIKALDALIAMQDEYWEREELYSRGVTLERALRAIDDRGKWLGSGLLERAYAEFTEVYKRLPRTLCHEDLLPINVLTGERAVFIDWEYGGMLPYLSPFARLIAHGREDTEAYFYMTREDRDFAVEYYYNGLAAPHGIAYEEYRSALELFLFYEYCEWIMLGNRYNGRDDERFCYYTGLAEDAARAILGPGE